MAIEPDDKLSVTAQHSYVSKYVAPDSIVQPLPSLAASNTAVALSTFATILTPVHFSDDATRPRPEHPGFSLDRVAAQTPDDLFARLENRTANQSDSVVEHQARIQQTLNQLGPLLLSNLGSNTGNGSGSMACTIR